MRAAWQILLFGGMLMAPACAAASDWPAKMAGAIAADRTIPFTNLNVSSRLDAALPFSTAACATARLPYAGPGLPIESSLVVFADPAACNSETALTTLQFYLHPASEADRHRFEQKMAQLVGGRCFAGQIKLNSRSRAQAARVTVWKLPAYAVAVSTQPELSDAFTISIIAEPAGESPARGLLARLVDDLPQQCR